MTQPAHVRAIRQGDWKLVRYCDPWSKKPVADEWELYNLAADGNEATNLLIYNASQFPTVIDESKFPHKLQMNTAAVAIVALDLRTELIRLEQQNLTPYPSAHANSWSRLDCFQTLNKGLNSSFTQNVYHFTHDI